MKDKQKKSLKMKRIWWTIKFVLPMFLLTLVFFSINGEKAISAPARWEDDFNDCPQQDLTNFPGQNCLAGQGICGVDTTGVDLAQCYSKASMNYPTASTTSSTVYASGEDGGYVVNCYVDMDATAPYCDNSGTWWCNRDATCNAQNRETECIGGGTAFSCEDCYSGYYDCTGDATCEIRSGVTACPDAHGTYNTTCGCNCSAYWYNCDGDATTCEWGGTNVDNENYRFTSACATSSFECLPGYDDCNADLNEANINADTTDGCEIDEWDTNFGAAGLNNRYNDSCTVICDANYYDCDGFGATTTNGCEVQNAASCTVGQLSGTWDGPNCNCVVPTSYFETGVMAEFATTSPLLWGYQYGTGPLMQFTSWGASSPGSMLTVGMDSGNQFLVNSTGVVTAGTWNGSIIDVAYGGTGTSTFEANSLLFASSDNNISEVLIGLEGYSLAVVGGKPTWVASSTGAAHPLLSVSHADTSEEAVLRGALIVGRQNASLEWARLTLGSNGYILYSDGTDAIWQSFENLWDINMLATTSMPHITDLGGLATVGTITSGIWNGSTIDVAHGGTGLTSVSGGYLLVGNSASALQATSSIFVADSGFVGIGTTTPQYNTVIIGTTSVDTICLGGSCIADWGQSGAIDGSGSTNYVTYWQDGNTLTSEAQLANTRGGTGQNSSGWTGIAAINGGTWSASTSIQNVYIADDLTVTGGVIGSNNISGTLTTTNTLTIGDDGDNIIISASNWDVNASGQITAGTDETINGIDISGGVISDVTGLTVNGNIIVSGFVDGVDISAASSTWDAKQDAITGAATTVLTSDLTADRALISNGSGKIAVSGTISSTELGYLDNVSSSIQTQLNSKWDELSDMALTQGYIFVGDSNDDPKATSSIFITSIGNVGIGSTSPMYDFVVVGTSSADTICLDGSCISNWGESGAISGSGNTGYAAYWSNATTLAGEQYLATSRGGTNQNSSGWTGIAAINGGTWSASTSIQNVYIADDLTVTGGVIGSNNISGTLTTTNTLTIGDDGDNIIISASNWDVNASGQITAGTDETINGIDISGGVISDVTGLTVNGNIIVSGFVDGVDISAASSTWDAKQDAITGAATTVLTSDLTADRALISNGSGKIAVSGTISSTELGYLDNVSSSIQTQLNSKWDELSDMALTQGYIFEGDSNDDPKATSSIFITSIGNVGIGSTSPMYDFVVVGTSSADTICLDGSCISNWGESGAISGSGNTGYAAYWSNATTLAGEQYLATSRGGTNQNSSGWNGVVNVVGGTWSTITGTANNITYWSDANTIKATTSIYLADSSFVGIGTSSPINQLDVRGNLGVLNQNELRFYEQEGSGHNYVAFKASTTLGSNFTWILPTTAGADGEALMMGSNNKLEWGTPVGAGTNESSTAGYITYYKTGGTTVSGTSTIFIAPNGYVGIGSGTPNNLLSIGDNININAAGTITGGTWQGAPVGLTYGGLGGNFNSSTGYLYVAGGTTIATSTIYIGNTDLNAGTGLTLSGNTINLDEFTMGTTDTDATLGSIFFAGTGGAMQQDNANLFWDDTNNRLGIGSSSPQQTLTIQGVVGQGILNIASSTGESIFFVNEYDNIGIGTISPSEKLVLNNGNFLQTEGTPIKLGGVNLGDDGRGLWIKDNYAYVVSANYLSVVDITNPSHPIFIASTTIGTGVSAYGIRISGTYAYVVGGSASDDDIHIFDKYLYLGSLKTGGFEIYDISDPLNAVRLGGTSVTANDAIKSIWVVNNKAYVVSNSNSYNLEVFNVSDPTNPTLLDGLN